MRKKRKRVTVERVGGKGARGTVQSGSIRKPPGQGRRSSWKEREKAGGGEQRGRKERERLAGRDDEGVEGRGAPVPSISRSVTDDE